MRVPWLYHLQLSHREQRDPVLALLISRSVGLSSYLVILMCGGVSHCIGTYVSVMICIYFKSRVIHRLWMFFQSVAWLAFSFF